MLSLAEKYRPVVAERIGYDNVEFRKGRIQDLALDLRKLDEYLRTHPVDSVEDLSRLEAYTTELRKTSPLVADDSVDVVVSNCVLNLVRPEDKDRLFREIYRVLRRGGRAVISDIVADEDVPEELQRDPELWSGCISGALREDAFLEAFTRVGFYGVELLKRDDRPWQVVEGIEFRSVTVAAYKGKEGPCLERKQAVIYKGPWSQVKDDDGHVLIRGQRMAVCDKTFNIYKREPYAEHLYFVEPYEEVPLDEAGDFLCRGTHFRHPRETKGQDYDLTTEASSDCCGPGEKCC